MHARKHTGRKESCTLVVVDNGHLYATFTPPLRLAAPPTLQLGVRATRTQDTKKTALFLTSAASSGFPELPRRLSSKYSTCMAIQQKMRGGGREGGRQRERE